MSMLSLDEIKQHANSDTKLLIDHLEAHAGDVEEQARAITSLFGGGRLYISAMHTIKLERAKKNARSLFEQGADVAEVSQAVDGISLTTLRRVRDEML